MRIVLLIALFVLAFGGSFAGAYLAMDNTLAEPAGSAESEGPAEPAPTPLTEATTTPAATTVTPATTPIVAPAGVEVSTPTDSLGREAWEATLEAQSRLVAGLVDSLSSARGRIIAVTARADALDEEVDLLEEAANTRQSRNEVATAMASTLPKLDPKELSPILDGLDDGSLDDLYEAASSRNRTAILQALNPERASDLVVRFISLSDPAATLVSDNSQQNQP
jgi:hypothetical protein